MKQVFYFDVIEPMAKQINNGPHKEYITRYWFEDMDVAHAQRAILLAVQRDKHQRILPHLNGAKIGLVTCPPQKEIGTR